MDTRLVLMVSRILWDIFFAGMIHLILINSTGEQIQKTEF